MLRWSVIFLIIAIVAAVFGFGGIAGGAASIAKILFVIFLILFVITLVTGRKGGATGRDAQLCGVTKFNDGRTGELRNGICSIRGSAARVGRPHH